MPKAELGARSDLKVIDPKEIPHVLEEGVLGAALEWMVRDPSGKVIEHVVKKSESYVQQFLQLLFCKFASPPTAFPLTNVRDTGNALRSIAYYNSATPQVNIFNMTNVAADTTYGILVGTGVGAPAISNFAMGTLIAHGVGGGQMQYGAVSAGAPGADAATSQFTVTRNFTANAGGITVNEAGVVARAYDGAARFFLIIRDVIGGGIVVGAGNTLTINYRLQGTV